MPRMGGWIAGNWFDFLQTVAIVTGLFATVHNIRADRRERMVNTQFMIAAGHREIWSRLADNPNLSRVLSREADLSEKPVTLEEELLVQFLILHLRATFKARRAKMDFADDRIALDTRYFFTLPIPRAVWEKSRALSACDEIGEQQSNAHDFYIADDFSKQRAEVSFVTREQIVGFRRNRATENRNILLCKVHLDLKRIDRESPHIRKKRLQFGKVRGLFHRQISTRLLDGVSAGDEFRNNCQTIQKLTNLRLGE